VHIVSHVGLGEQSAQMTACLETPAGLDERATKQQELLSEVPQMFDCHVVIV